MIIIYNLKRKPAPTIYCWPKHIKNVGGATAALAYACMPSWSQARKANTVTLYANNCRLESVRHNSRHRRWLTFPGRRELIGTQRHAGIGPMSSYLSGA